MMLLSFAGRTVDGDTFEAKVAIWPKTYMFEHLRVLGVDHCAFRSIVITWIGTA